MSICHNPKKMIVFIQLFCMTRKLVCRFNWLEELRKFCLNNDDNRTVLQRQGAVYIGDSTTLQCLPGPPTKEAVRKAEPPVFALTVVANV